MPVVARVVGLAGFVKVTGGFVVSNLKQFIKGFSFSVMGLRTNEQRLSQFRGDMWKSVTI